MSRPIKPLQFRAFKQAGDLAKAQTKAFRDIAKEAIPRRHATISGTVRTTICVTKKQAKAIKRNRDINWSEVCRRAIDKVIEQLKSGGVF